MEKNNLENSKKSFFDSLPKIVDTFLTSILMRIRSADRIPKLKGSFELVVTDLKGNVLETYFDPNLVVNGGREAVMKLLGAGDTDKQLTQISVGTNGTAPTGSDNSITGAFTKNLGAVSYPTISSVQFAWTIGALEANGINIAEFGLLCDDDTLFARKVRAVIAKNSDIILNGTWTISF